MIGIYYLYISFIFGINGSLCSIIIRCELYSNTTRIFLLENYNYYNLYFTLHGLFMIFFLLIPFLYNGFGNYFIPIMIILLEILFPIINILSFYILLLSFYIIILSLSIEFGIGLGWTLYPPLSTSLILLSPLSINNICYSLILSGFSSIMSVINFISTIIFNIIFNLLLLYIYCIFFTSLLLLFTIPILSCCLLLLLFDININTTFYNSYFNGDSIFYQHLFWFFGHPEVYILIIPGFAIISESISYCTIQLLFGYQSMVIAIVCICIIGSIVWTHHMYLIGLESDTKSYFTLITVMISIPTGTKIFNWSSTYENNIIILSLNIIYFNILFLITFTIGGVTGVILSNSIIDLTLHDTYYVIAHFHFVLSLGAIICVLTGFFYYHETLFCFNHIFIFPCSFIMKYHFISKLIGIFKIFIPLHLLGFNVMPRRFPDFPDFLYSWNIISSLASGLTLLSLYIMYCIICSNYKIELKVK